MSEAGLSAYTLTIAKLKSSRSTGRAPGKERSGGTGMSSRLADVLCPDVQVTQLDIAQPGAVDALVGLLVRHDDVPLGPKVAVVGRLQFVEIYIDRNFTVLDERMAHRYRFLVSAHGISFVSTNVINILYHFTGLYQ